MKKVTTKRCSLMLSLGLILSSSIIYANEIPNIVENSVVEEFQSEKFEIIQNIIKVTVTNIKCTEGKDLGTFPDFTLENLTFN